MKNSIVFGLALCGLLAPVVPTYGAEEAKSADQEKPTRQTVVVGLSQFKSEIILLRNSLSGTVAALQEIKETSAKNGDLSKPYARYNEAYAALEKNAETVRQHGLAAKARSKEFWEVWQKELTSMQNVALREKAQERFKSTAKQFEKIVERAATAKEDFAPVTADLKDINTYLKTDLSNDAISSLSNTIWKLGNAAKKVDGRLEDVVEEIDRTVKKMPTA